MSIFRDNKLEESQIAVLSPIEKKLFYFMIRRKFINRNSRLVANELIEPDVQTIRRILDFPPVKKTDECYKFVLIRILAFARRELELSSPTEITNDQFYELIFGETAQQQGVPIKEYHYPLTREFKGEVYLNAKYFHRIFKCEKLIDIGKRFFKLRIFESHNKEIVRKLTQVVLTWEKMFQKQQILKDVSVEKLLSMIYSKKRYSIPWTNFELNHALNKYQKYVTKNVERNHFDSLIRKETSRNGARESQEGMSEENPRQADS